MVASTIDGRPPRLSPIQGWARRSRSGAQPIHGQKGYPAPAFFAELIDSLVPRKATGSATFTRATTAYVSAVSATGNAVDGEILILCASGEARFSGARRVSEGVWSRNYADGTAIPNANLLGYLAEGARTNRCLQSEEFDNVAWTATNITVGAEVAAPDGATTAETLTASAGNGTIIQDLGVVASAAKTFSVYLKRKTGTGNIDLTMDGGATWTTVAVTSSWARHSVTQTLADEDVGIRIVTNTDAIYAWGAQVETASFASSYIPTTAAAATRTYDVLNFPSSGNIANASGTAYCEATVSLTGASTAPLIDTFNGAAEGAPLYVKSSELRLYDGTAERTLGTVTLPIATRKKLASKWSGAVCAGFADGVRLAADTTFDGSLSVSATIGIGHEPGTVASQIYGNIRNVRIWTTALNDQQIAGL